MRFYVMVACSSNGGIGINGKLPWKISNDLRYFQQITTNTPKDKKNAIIMGRKTWESLPKKPLPHRINVIISSTVTGNDISIDKDVLVCTSFENALTELKNFNVHKIFVIGGGQIYNIAIDHPDCSYIYMTKIIYPDNIDFDTVFPLERVNSNFKKVATSEVIKEDIYKFIYEEYERNDI